MKDRWHTAFSFTALFALNACATMERGQRDSFIVYTTPIAASVTTDMAIETSTRANKTQKDRYFGCAPTPCSINMPRKTGFSVLITKDGYLPQSYKIESLPYKEMIKRNQQTVVGTTITAGAITGASILTVDAILMGIGGASSGVAATAIAITALPVAAAGGLSLAVDAGTGANHDFYPNPMSITLVKQTTEDEAIKVKQFIEGFDTKRRTQSPYQHYKENKH